MLVRVEKNEWPLWSKFATVPLALFAAFVGVIGTLFLARPILVTTIILLKGLMLLEHASTASKIKSADFSNCLVSLEQNVPGTQDLLHVIFLNNFVSGFSQKFCLPWAGTFLFEKLDTCEMIVV